MHRSVNHRAAPDRVDRDHSCQGNAYRTAAGVRNEAQEHFRAVGAEGHAQLQVRRLACVGTDACAPNDSARLGSAVIGCRSAHIGQCSPPDARHGAAVAVPLTQAHAALGAAAAATNPSRRKSRAKPRRSEVAAAIRTRKSHLLRPFPFCACAWLQRVRLARCDAMLLLCRSQSRKSRHCLVRHRKRLAAPCGGTHLRLCLGSPAVCIASAP
jgi:hypothetical protein